MSPAEDARHEADATPLPASRERLLELLGELLNEVVRQVETSEPR
jgi:hypothetical protein